jgi:hypothetical protein
MRGERHRANPLSSLSLGTGVHVCAAVALCANVNKLRGMKVTKNDDYTRP